MTNLLLNSERTFEIWKYTTVHTQLLLRTTGIDPSYYTELGVEYSNRIEVVFGGAVAFHLPVWMHGLSITEVSESEIPEVSNLKKAWSHVPKIKIFKLQGKDFIGYVAAGAFYCRERECSNKDPSLFSEPMLEKMKPSGPRENFKPDAIISVRFKLPAEGGFRNDIKFAPEPANAKICRIVVDEKEYVCRIFSKGGEILRLGQTYELSVEFIDPKLGRPKLSIGKSIKLRDRVDFALGEVVRIV